MRRLTIDPANPDPDVIQGVADMLLNGAIAVIPTDTLYGLAANPFDTRAVDRIYRVKRREAGQGLPLIAASRSQVESVFGSLNNLTSRLAERYWPGPLTLLVPRPPALGTDVTGGSDRVAVRVPGHDVARMLCAACGTPLTATSANLSGQPPSHDPDVVARTSPAGIDLLLDAGLTLGGAASTIVDATGVAPVLLRAGPVAWEEILECLRAR
jgi:L-threonylcarbamoyladenylate synthase